MPRYPRTISIISQDTERDQQYSFVDKSGTSGKLGTKDNILRGTPALFTSQVIDDTKTLRFSEKNRRFININPDTSIEKIRAANNIIGLKHGFLPEEYDELVVSRADKEKARQIVKIMIAKLKQHTKYLGPKEDGVKIPFVLSITNSIPDNHVWSMTITDRTIKYLGIITKVNMDARPKLVNEETGQFFPIATFEDLKETLKLMRVGASGARPYIVNWYNKVFISAIKDLGGKPYEKIKTDEDSGRPVLGVDGSSVLIAKERHIGVNTEQLAVKTKEVLKGAKPSNKELRDKYLEPLVNLGVLDKVQSEIDRRENIYVPVEEGSLFHIFEDDSGLKIKIPSDELFPSKNFLEKQFRTFVKKNADDMVVLEKNFSRYKLIDPDGSEISIDQLIDGYFNSPEDCFTKPYKDTDKDRDKEESSDSNNELTELEAENVSDDDSSGSFTTDTMFKAAAASNILYSSELVKRIQQQTQDKNFFEKSLPDVRSILTEIPKKEIEEYYYYCCYYCDSFKTNSEGDYKSHVIHKHGLGHPCYPSKADLEKLGLKAQRKSWEI